MSTIPELIAHKRSGLTHSRADLEQLILGYVAGTVPDYQVSAWLMAVYWRGMSAPEVADLTQVMARSGDMLNLSELAHTVDKHSTGGVGDKTSLVLMPMLAALGFTVAKMSGRGLAHTGGTVDKLESIPGWQSELSEAQFLAQARDIGLSLVGQSKNLAPADGLLYALRDVTATVDSLPLIASSIMSKKLASGAQTIVLDVKVGQGAFMKTLSAGCELARAMVSIGEHAGRTVRAVLTGMDTPLGHMAGNSLEVQEAVFTLQGRGPADLTELCVALAVEALLAHDPLAQTAVSQTAVSYASAEARARQVLQDGSALSKLRAFVQAQGGDPIYIDHPERLDVAPDRAELQAQQTGYLAGLDALAVGQAVLALGGGRERKGEAIDHGVGVEVLKKPGERVATGEVVARLYHRSGRGLETAHNLLQEAFAYSEQTVSVPPLILERIGEERA